MERLNLFTGLSFLLMAVLTGCSTNNGKSDAYGQFEATEINVSAQANGQLTEYTIEEGVQIEKGAKVGVVDTTQQSLQKIEVRNKMAAVRTQLDQIEAQIEVQKTELDVAQKDYNRVKNLVADSAATQKQLDDLEGRIRVLKKQIKATQSKRQSVIAEIKSLSSKLLQIDNQIENAVVFNPVYGTVLSSYVEPTEVVRFGQKLYTIADLSTMYLRVFVSGAQLPNIELGQEVEVLYDKNATENQSVTGTVSWIASEAEFTPKMIQTKEERVSQVYAVKIRVKNNGDLKIGMPGEANFASSK